MDDMEKKEEQESVSETIETAEQTAEVTEETVAEEAAEAEATEEAVSEETEIEETTATEKTEEITPVAEPTEKPAEKGGSNVFAILAGLVVFAAILVYCWMLPGANAVQDTSVLYAKEDNLYLYDLENEPYLVQEKLADGGSYHYFYSAWGANVTEDNTWAYYLANIDETGAANLYRKNIKDADAKAEQIDDQVYDYMASKSGDVVAYLAMEGDALELRCFDGEKAYTEASGLTLANDVYSLSADGRYLVYKDAYDMLCAAKVGEDAEAVVLTDEAPLYALAEETGVLYFVSKTGESYSIYSYAFDEKDPVLVAENAQYMELMANGRDLLYGVKPTEIIPYSELIVDDMAEIDAAMAETDENYEQKQMRDEIREAAKNGEGIAPMLQEYYVLTNGKARLLADNVVTAIAVDSERTFITGYKAKDFEPVHLSVVGGGLDMVDMIYYMSLNYGGMQPFLADGSGNVEVLTGDEIQLDSIQISQNGKKAAYLTTDQESGESVLMQMEIGKAAEAEVVQTNVKSFAFLGGNGPLCYYYGYEEGNGTIGSVDSDKVIENATGVQFAEDRKAVYYITGVDSENGLGQMQYWDGKGEAVTLDDGIFAFQYKGNGKAAVLYNYDVYKQIGDLGYYDGKNMTMLDEGITSIFIY